DGVATGQVILSGDEGGEKGRRLLQGIAAGIVGSLASLPMAGIGIAFIGNPISLGALGVALVLRGFGSAWFEGSYFPHGFMIGAGLVQAAQTIRLVAGRATIRGRELYFHLFSFFFGALVLYLVAHPSGTSLGQLALWLVYAALAAFIHTLIVGYCAMLTGWFPSFAVAIALVLVAVLLRFPLALLALLSGYILSTGPLFADLGYDLKAGWIVRGEGRDPERERFGRRQQFLLQELGGLVGIVFVALFYGSYFQLGLIPPMGKALATTVSLQISAPILREVLAAALAGAALQIAGGPSRALGILFATGLLLVNPIYGVGLLLAVSARLLAGDAFMEIRAPGLIAGDGLASFFRALWLVLR
ncbi:MAG: peptide transporter, partial [Acidobacteria bacterium]|nr:peptide transporter [Acidobacteriota bacterium]